MLCIKCLLPTSYSSFTSTPMHAVCLLQSCRLAAGLRVYICFPRQCLEFNIDFRRWVLYFAICCAPSMHLFFRSHKDSGPVLLKTSEDPPRCSRHSPQAEPKSQILQQNLHMATDQQTRVPQSSGARDSLGRVRAEDDSGWHVQPPAPGGTQEGWSYPHSQGYNPARGSGGHRSASPGLPGLPCSLTQSTSQAPCEQEGGGKIPLSVWPPRAA